MKQVALFTTVILAIVMTLLNAPAKDSIKKVPPETRQENFMLISGIVEAGETLEAIFHKLSFSQSELSEIFLNSIESYNLSRLSVGNVYSFRVDKQENRIRSMKYEIDDRSYLKVVRTPDGFSSKKVHIQYTKKVGSLYLTIRDNLIRSLPSSHREYLQIAFKLADIFAWDIDFSTDIRDGDSVKIIIEELWSGDVFKGYGNILSAEFSNNGKIHQAYRFEHNGNADYYNEHGESLRKALLRTPLKFRYISSGFSRRRFHPVLRIYRPHLGVDYVAPRGTPVSAAGKGTVFFSGYKGQNGNMVIIRHDGGFMTYYGHLSKISKRIRKGVSVSQDNIIGYVGSTGLSTGPHLDYRVKHKGKFVNPLKVHLPSGNPVPESLMAEFNTMVENMNTRIASLTQPYVASSEQSVSVNSQT